MKFNRTNKKPIIYKNDWHLYSLNFDQNKMFIMQNPGEGLNLKQWQKERKEQIQMISEWHKNQATEKLTTAIIQMQIGLKDWLKNKNQHFHYFFKLLSEEKIIQDLPPKTYLNDKFITDFYVTDLFKYRVATRSLGKAVIGNKKGQRAFQKDLMYDLDWR